MSGFSHTGECEGRDEGASAASRLLKRGSLWVMPAQLVQPRAGHRRPVFAEDSALTQQPGTHASVRLDVFRNGLGEIGFALNLELVMTEAVPTVFPVGGPGIADPRDGTRMEILCACDERYLPHTATMLCSLLENNRVYRIHLFYDESATNNLPTLKAFVEEYETELLCYEMVPQSFRDLQVDRKVSTATYYRLAAPYILSSNVRKILYLDSDIIVRRSLEDLWNTDIQDYALAAVIDPWWSPGGGPHVELPPGAKYFNAGVLLINLDYWRKNNVSENATAFVRNNFEKVHYWDQDALNAILVDR